MSAARGPALQLLKKLTGPVLQLEHLTKRIRNSKVHRGEEVGLHA